MRVHSEAIGYRAPPTLFWNGPPLHIESILSDTWSEMTPPDTIAAKEDIYVRGVYAYATRGLTTQLPIANRQVFSHPIPGLTLVP